MIVGDMEIRLRADIARLQRDMDDARRVVSTATAGMERAANAAKAAFGSIASALGGRELIEMADQYTKYTSQLKLATESEREYAKARADVKRIANDAQQDLAATGTLYARIANGTRELGTTQKEVAAITETVNLALKVSGATASESASAQLQLSQAFASGTLRGEEFNAVNEAAPRLMKALADGMGLPVGALKEMASNGEITSKIMADVLPQALADLQEEAKEVQTIAGGFTLLKNAAVEFVGVQAQANGVVAAATGGLTLLANNLTLVAGSVATLGVAKLGSVIGGWVTETYKQVTAAAALRAANIAAAESQVAAASAALAKATADRAALVGTQEHAVAQLRATNATIASSQASIAAASAAGAQSFALRVLREATSNLAAAESMRAALLVETAALDRAKLAASAQITAATTAQATAQASLNAATAAGVGAAGLASRALGFLGGPIGAVITLLGLGATAWTVWKSKSVESEKEVARTLAEETEEYIGNIQRQIDKLNERNELAGKRMTSGAEPTTDYEKRREAIMAEINRISKQADLGVEAKTELLRVWGGRLNQLTVDMEKLSIAQQKNKDITFDAKYAEWLGKNGTAAQKEAYELAELRKEYGRVTPEMEKWVKAKYADKGAATAVKQEATAYQTLITSIREKIGANQLELSGYDKLTESQKATIKLDAEIATGKTKLSADSIKKARADIEQLAATEELLDAQQRAAKAAELEAKNFSGYLDKVRSGTDAIDERIVQMQREIDLHGLTASAAIDAERAKLEAKLAAGPATYAELAALDAQIEKLGKLAELTRNKEALDESKKAADQVVEDQKRVWGDFERTAHDTFVSVQDGGKNMWRRLKESGQNMFFDWLYQMTAKKWLINVGTSMGLTGGVSGAAQAVSGAGSAGEGGSLLSSASSAAGLSGVMGTVGSYMATGFMNTVAGTGLMSGLSAAGSMIGGGSVASGIGMGIGALGPYALAAAAVIAVLKKGFGYGPKETTRTSIDGTFVDGGGFSGNINELWKKNGGWFVDDKTGMDQKAVGAEMVAALNQAYTTLKTSTASYIETLGVNADHLRTRSQNLSVALTGDAAKDEKAIADFFAKISDDIALQFVPSLTKFQQAGESTSATLQRLAGDYALVDQALTSIGMAFTQVGVDSLAARERLIANSGGAQSFAANTAGFAQNFLTEEQRNAPVLAMVRKELDALGMSAVDTREEFAAAVLGLNVVNEAESERYGKLIQLQGAFAQVYPAIEKTTAAVVDSAEAQRLAAEAWERERAVGNQARALEAERLILTGDALAGLRIQRDLELETIPKVLHAAKELNWALEDQATAQQAASAAQEKAKQDAAVAWEREREIGNRARSIEAERLKLVGDAAGALRIERDLELETLPKVLHAVKEHNWALIDQAEAAKLAKDAADKLAEADRKRVADWSEMFNAARTAQAAAAAKAEAERTAAADKAIADAKILGDKRAGMETELYNLTHTSVEQLARARELELAALDPTLRGLQQQIHAAQDLAKAQEAARAVATEREGLERELLQVQGDTAALRALELAKLDPANRALREHIWALQDQAEAAKAATQAMATFNPDQLIAQATADMITKAQKAWRSIGDSLIDEVNRIRGVVDVGTMDSLDEAQARFAVTTAQARAGDQGAAKLLPEMSRALLDMAQQEAVTSLDLRRIQAATIASLTATAEIASKAQYGRGLEFIAPQATAPAWQLPPVPSASSAPQASGSGNAELLAEVRGMRTEITASKEATRRLADLMEQVTEGGNAMRTTADE